MTRTRRIFFASALLVFGWLLPVQADAASITLNNNGPIDAGSRAQLEYTVTGWDLCEITLQPQGTVLGGQFLGNLGSGGRETGVLTASQTYRLRCWTNANGGSALVGSEDARTTTVMVNQPVCEGFGAYCSTTACAANHNTLDNTAMCGGIHCCLPNPPIAVAQCGTTHFNCVVGTPTEMRTFNMNYSWWCDAGNITLGNGAIWPNKVTNCTEAKNTTPPPAGVTDCEQLGHTCVTGTRCTEPGSQRVANPRCPGTGQICCSGEPKACTSFVGGRCQPASCATGQTTQVASGCGGGEYCCLGDAAQQGGGPIDGAPPTRSVCRGATSGRAGNCGDPSTCSAPATAEADTTRTCDSAEVCCVAAAGTGTGTTPQTPPGTLPDTPSGTAPGNAKLTPTSFLSYPNPLNYKDVNSLTIGLLTALQGLIVTLALIMIVVGAIIYITSAGDDGRMETAKKTILAAIIGLAIGIAAPVFLREIGTLIGWTTPTIPAGFGSALTLTQILERLLTFLLTIIGVISLVMLVVGGITYLTAAGDDDRIDRGKKIVTYSLIGITVALAALVLVKQVAAFFS